MGCSDDFDACGDRCRPAVERTYREMRGHGQPETVCLEAATTVYRWHHPEVPLPAALHRVSSWVFDGLWN
jgi:hypothetical protein